MSEDTKLEIGDRIALITERIGKPGSFSMDNPRLRNLNTIWNAYSIYLQAALKKGPGPAFPVWFIEDDLKLGRMIVGTNTLNRAWFEERKPNGTEIFWPHPYKPEGFQWWILSWTWNRGLLSVNVTHWMIHRDDERKRSIVYFTRGFDFIEDPSVDEDYPPKIAKDNTRLEKVPHNHRRRVMELAKHATKHDDNEWILTLAPYSLFETMSDLHNMIENLDVGDIRAYYIDREFKAFWLRRVLDALWDGDWRPKSNQIDFDGLLEEAWYIPKHQHPLDKERYDKYKAEWVEFRKWYEEAHSIWLQVLTKDKKVSELVPQKDGVT